MLPFSYIFTSSTTLAPVVTTKLNSKSSQPANDFPKSLWNHAANFKIWKGNKFRHSVGLLQYETKDGA